MATVIVLLWLAVSLYAVVGLFRPLRPFGSRRRALFGLLAAFIVATVALGLVVPRAPKEKPTQAKPVQSQSVATSSTATSGADGFTVVRSKPGEHSSESPHAEPQAVATYRALARARLKYLSSLEDVLGTAIDRQQPQLARQASLEASKTGSALTDARGSLIGTAELEFAMHCERAAYELGRLADKIATPGIDYETVQDRASLFASYNSQRRDCERWVTL